MRNSKREQKYIGFLLGMLMTMLLCFGLVCVTAEPTTDPVTAPATETPADPAVTQEAPAETTPAETVATVAPVTTAPATTAPVTEAPTQPATTPPVTKTPIKKTPIKKTPTRKPTAVVTPSVNTTPPATTAPATTAPATTGSTVTPTPVPPVTQAPVTVTPAVTPTILPPLTPTPTETTPTVTVQPVDPGASLPEYSPQIIPGKPAADPQAPAEPAPALDMHGYVLRIAAPWDEYQDAMLNKEAIAAFEAKYNCKVLFLDLSEETLYNRLLMSQATGTTYFDAVLVEGTDILVNLEPLGVLQSLSQYMTEAELAALPVSYQKFLSKDGVLYGIPVKAPDVSGLWYNPAVSTQYQYASPLNVYNGGNWDWNQFTSYLQEATKDLDSDGFYNTYGLATSSPWYLSALEATGGSMFRWSGSQFVPGVTNALSVQGLFFARGIYRSHYVASDYERYFYTGQAPYLAGELSMYTELKSYMKGQLLFMPYPSANGLAPYKTVATSVPSAAITATSVYPEQTAELLKILYGGDALNQRIEAYCTESGFTKEIKSEYLKMLENFTVDYTNAFDTAGQIRLKLVSLLKNQEITTQVLQDNVQPLLEQAIKEKSTKVNLKEVPVEIRW